MNDGRRWNIEFPIFKMIAGEYEGLMIYSLRLPEGVSACTCVCDLGRIPAAGTLNLILNVSHTS